jgi:cardiolipin synthase
VAVAAALPGGPIRTFFVRRDLRYHRKLIVVDDRVGWTGSQNLVDPRLFKSDLGVGEWVDCMARVTGPAAAALAALSRLDWSVEARVPCELPPLPELPDRLEGAGSCVQVVPSGPQPQPEAIYMLVLESIYTARRELTITTPYFVPDETVLVALRSAAMRGVRVRLVVPTRNDSTMADQAGRSHFETLMEAGVEIHLFGGGLLHTKSVTIDGTTGVFGSVNLDARSLRLNFELSLFLHDAELTGRLAALQEEYVAMSRRVDPEVWAARPAWRRLSEGLMRLLSPLL